MIGAAAVEQKNMSSMKNQEVDESETRGKFIILHEI
jgi:hypothetical protein